MLDVGRHSKRDIFRNSKLSTFFKADVIIDVDDLYLKLHELKKKSGLGNHSTNYHLSAAQVNQNVVQMPITQSNSVANHRSDGTRLSETQSRRPPLLGVQTTGPELPKFTKDKKKNQ